MQVSVEKDARSDIPDIETKKLVSPPLFFFRFFDYIDPYCCNGIGMGISPFSFVLLVYHMVLDYIMGFTNWLLP